MNHLQSVKSITGCTAFTDFSWKGSPARRYNLIYGWNGAGKTTIARILSFFEQELVHLDGFEQVQVRLQTDEGVVTESDLFKGRLPLRVFDQEFVRRNLSFEASAANPIIILGEANVEAENRITDLNASIQKAEETRAGLREALETIPDVSKVLTDCGTAVVREFAGTPFATDQYYGRSYNRRRVQQLLEDKAVNGQSLASFVIDDDSSVETLRQQVSATRSNVRFQEPHLQSLLSIFERGNAVVRETVSVATIEELEEDDEVRQWVREGRRLHEEREHSTCLFCTNPLPPGLMERYGEFFTDEVSSVEAAIKDLLAEMQQIERQLQEDLPDSGEFFPDLASEYLKIKPQVQVDLAAIVTACESLRRALESRQGRVQIAGSEGEEVRPPESEVAGAIGFLSEIAQLCSRQAARLAEGEEAINRAARRLELHTVASMLSAKDYFKHAAARQTLESRILDLDQEIRSHEGEIRTMQAALRNMDLALRDINSLVAQFLGAGQIELGIGSEAESGSYRVTSRGEPARYLSEGEKSVVALAYFLAKLREESCDPEKTIVVLDDPVDSQDAVFLFRTYGLLRRRLQNVGQLFVFTHNHEFFNLVRDWLCSPTYYKVSALFWMEMGREEGERNAVVMDLPALLKDHKSEYQYLFYRLYARYRDIEMLDDPLVPNVARKVLETFAAFKWSCRSSERLSSIVLNRFVRSEDRRRSGVGDSVLKFLNEYSHGGEFERPVSSAVMESSTICQNVLELIRLGDNDHYQSLVSLFEPDPS